MLLNSPEVLCALAAEYRDAIPDIRMSRIRFAVDPDASFVALAESTYLEVYDGEGVQLVAVRVVDLPNGVSNAVQVELMAALLRTKGIEIPLL